ncbi:MAG: adenylyltransferase/sulfurtransferase MoeZ [Mycobacterium sp.]
MGTAPPLPPLVEPAAELSGEEVARYSRHLIIPDLGMVGQKRLKNARVLVVGAGGLGSPALLYLAAAGVGTIGIVEDDAVEESNLQRQIIHRESDVGRPKARSAAESIRRLNRFVSTRLHEFRLTADNALGLFADYDLVIDGSDNFATRYLVNDAAVLAGKPYVWGSIFRFEGQVSVFWEGAPGDRGLNYRDLFPEPPLPGTVPSCAEGGVLGVLCASIGAVMATEAVKLITGIGDSLLGRLMIYDALAMTYRTIPVRKDPEAPKVTGLCDYERFCGFPDGEPRAASAITPVELRELLSAGAVDLIDVREPAEWAINRIGGARLLPKSVLDSGAGLSGVPRDRAVVLYCKTGIRSAAVAATLKEAGFADVRHLEGGIAAWAGQLEPDMVMY